MSFLSTTLQNIDAGARTLTLYIGSLLWVFSNSQGGSLLLLSSSQQVSHTLVIDLQEAAGTEG